MPTVTVALICHDSHLMIRRKFHELRAWTRQPDEVLLLYTQEAFPDGVSRVPGEWRQLPAPDASDRGYQKRALALREATGDFILFVNYDDVHDLHCLERLVESVRPDTKVVHCRVGGKYGHGVGDEFRPHNSGAENHIVRVDFARSIGGYEAAIAANPRTSDKPWIEMINAATAPGEIVCVSEILIILL